MSRYIPETDEEWKQLHARNMRRQDSHPPLRYVVLFVLVIAAICKLWIFPAWDRQVDDLYQQQRAMEQACERAGGVVTEDGCRGLRHKP
jgi:uncharacterized ion transporter superfamily protein YfcC